MKIQDTSSLGRDYSECEEFINICTSAFPTAIELPYTELANYFLDYAISSGKVRDYSSGLDSQAKDMSELRNSVAGLSTREQQVLDSLRSLLSHYDNEKNLSPDVWKSLQQLTSAGFTTSKERDVKSTNLSMDTNQYMDQSLDTRDQQEVMRNSIAGMQQSLDAIQHLDIDGQRRIDRVEVSERHMERIDAIPNISSEQKETLKNMLVSYVGMRVESFKAVEDLAHRAVGAYQHGEILDVHFSDSEFRDKYLVAMKGLDDLSSSFSEDLYGMINPTVYDVRKENFQADIMAMNMFRDYQKNGFVDKTEAFNLSMMDGLNYTTQDALVALGNTRDARSSELSAMLQDSSTANYVETNSMAK